MSKHNTYFLISGMILGTLDGVQFNEPRNAVFMTNGDVVITAPMLNQIQQSLVSSLVSSYPGKTEEDFNVDDVIITGTMFLGIMTPEQFAGSFPEEGANTHATDSTTLALDSGTEVISA